MSRKVLDSFLEKYGDCRIAIATHEGADVDAISCAYAMHRLLPKSRIFLKDDPKEEAMEILKWLDVETFDISSADKNDFDAMVIVDTSTTTLLPEAESWKIALIVDHHHPDGRDLKGEFEIIDENSPSAAELIADIYPFEDNKVATALAAAVIADGKRFKSARPVTFRVLHKLLEISEKSYNDILIMAEPELKNEAKIAVLKAFQRVEFRIIGKYIVATSEVSAHESDAASLLAEAAHASFVASWKGGNTRISARGSPSLSIPLNKVMSKASEGIGSGGGHPKASGASMNVHTEDALERCVDAFRAISEEESL